ncbi:phospholipase, patatin family protein [Aaosphaeria arxii CBS 175.79]|uniref:Phospholipase, patatin family protein n=1 Tax=Aaosphaeria arxii CBS 175.79 TaxID=1450172 RepID=A0A6A5Y9P7_9PLEO|nr:phospholipase, patatin family protein [Aaosphaeria arxii CBS 175.79]KAF2021481.1 phospholipase, patatin family protein [Aaosphaeria arxii CBS 175.79]
MATDDLLAPSSALSTPSTPQPRDGQTFDNTGYCVLSLDGGGVRGLSTLYILDSIINGINNERREAGLRPRKPCEIFDLIGGTSTGGLIAIMLGHLEMTVGECIEAYIKLMQQVFEKKVNRSFKGVGLFGTVQARFSSKALADAISQVIKSRGISLDEKFENGNKPRCRVFVCTKYQKTNVVTRLRNYRVRTSSDRGPTILEAALATTAAPTYFEGVAIEGSTYVDGALGANNPTIQVEEEATDLWSESDGQIQPLIKCFISIGTGEPGLGSVSDKGFRKLIETLKKEATETEKTTEQWLGRWRQHVERNRCFRFNVIHGLENVRLEEYKERDVIQSTTDTYLQSRGTQTNVRKCVENLRMKECTYRANCRLHAAIVGRSNGECKPTPFTVSGKSNPTRNFGAYPKRKRAT